MKPRPCKKPRWKCRQCPFTTFATSIEGIRKALDRHRKQHPTHTVLDRYTEPGIKPPELT
jgi:hypothetical protein